MQAAFQRCFHHRRMQLRRRRHDESIELLLIQHPVEISMTLQSRVLGKDVGKVGTRVATCDDLECWMGAQDREVRQAHLAQADHGGSDHRECPSSNRVRIGERYQTQTVEEEQPEVFEVP